MTGFSSALLTRKSFLSGSAKVGRTTNGGKTFALFKKAEKQVKKAAGQGKQTAKKVHSISVSSKQNPSEKLLIDLVLPVKLQPCHSHIPTKWSGKQSTSAFVESCQLITGQQVIPQEAWHTADQEGTVTNQEELPCTQGHQVHTKVRQAGAARPAVASQHREARMARRLHARCVAKSAKARTLSRHRHTLHSCM